MKVKIDPLDVDSITVEINGVPVRLSLSVEGCLILDSPEEYLQVGVVSSTRVMVARMSPPPKKGPRK